MPSRNEIARARARLQLETPISSDEDLLKWQDQAVEYTSEAKRRDPAGPNELVSSVIDTVARHYVDTPSENNDGALANTCSAVRSDDHAFRLGDGHCQIAQR